MSTTSRERQGVMMLSEAIFILITSTSGYCKEGRGEVKALMHTMAKELTELKPYIYSESAFKTNDAQVKVKKALVSMEKKTSHEAPALLDSTPGFGINYRLLQDHIQQTKKIFEAGELDYARIRLNATTNFCASCHSQIPEDAGGGGGFFGIDLSKMSVENAEYLFVFRRFDESLAMLDQLIRQYPKSKAEAYQLPDLYRRKLAIFSRVKRKPDFAIQNLGEDLQNKELPTDIQQNIKLWISYFENWKKEKSSPESLSTEKLIAYVKKEMPDQKSRKISPSDPDVVKYLRLSGLLYERLYGGQTGASAQELLFYLATCERNLSPLYWYPVSEVYLKECVRSYPKSALTKTCFDGYVDNMNNRYFGRQMPTAIKESIEALKSYL